MADIKPVVLVVDDEHSIRESFSLILGKEFKVVLAASGEAALKRITDEKVDLIYLDIRMPGLNGIETLKRLKQLDGGIDIIMVTAVNDVGSAGTAIKMGAKDYVVKPFDVDDILNRTRSIIIKAQAKRIRAFEKDDLLGNCRQMLDVKRSVEAASRTFSSLLITSEKGLEAEHIAEIISNEQDRPLVILSVYSDFKSAALFGSGKGSFTDEFEKHNGALEDANGGFLFIRNMELLPKDAQATLRACLEKGQVSREGSASPISIDVRLIAESSADLAQLVKSGEFDEGLYRMISGTIIELPPLRQRESDIPLLIDHYLEKFSVKHDRSMKLSPDAKDILAGYPWPGNMAELINTMESLVLNCGKELVAADDLPLDMLLKSTSGGRPYTTLDNMEDRLEKSHIMNVYRKVGHNKEKAAATLGIPLNTLQSKLESFSV